MSEFAFNNLRALHKKEVKRLGIKGPREELEPEGVMITHGPKYSLHSMSDKSGKALHMKVDQDGDEIDNNHPLVKRYNQRNPSS